MPDVKTGQYDCIIIGGGHNGLITAAYLARARRKVCVLERRHVLGGCCSTEELWPGFRLSPAADLLNFVQPQIVRELKLCRHGLKFIRRDPACFTPLGDGRCLLLGSDEKQNRLALGACEPDPQQRFADARAMLAELDRPLPPPASRRRRARRRTIVAAACVLVAGSAATFVLWPDRAAQSVDVNFISHPYEATIYLDGKQLLDSAGQPAKTPCTAEALPPRAHHVVFKHAGHDDLDAGRFNFAKIREIEVTWEPGR